MGFVVVACLLWFYVLLVLNVTKQKNNYALALKICVIKNAASFSENFKLFQNILCRLAQLSSA